MATRKNLLSFVLMISLLFTSTAFAMSNDSKENKQHHKKGQIFKNLSPEQRQQIKSIMKAKRSEFKALRKKCKKSNAALSATIKNKKSSWDDIKVKLAEVSKVKNEILTLRTQLRYEVYKKTGVLLPSKKHHRRHGGKKNNQ